MVTFLEVADLLSGRMHGSKKVGTPVKHTDTVYCVLWHSEYITVTLTAYHSLTFDSFGKLVLETHIKQYIVNFCDIAIYILVSDLSGLL